MLVVSLGFRKEIRTSLEPLCDVVICITFLASVTKCLTKVIMEGSTCFGSQLKRDTVYYGRCDEEAV